MKNIFAGAANQTNDLPALAEDHHTATFHQSSGPEPVASTRGSSEPPKSALIHKKSFSKAIIQMGFIAHNLILSYWRLCKKIKIVKNAILFSLTFSASFKIRRTPANLNYVLTQTFNPQRSD